MIRVMRQIMSCLLIALGVMGMTGCSIKEDRSECPCWLNLDLSRVCLEEGDSLGVFITSETGWLYSEWMDETSLLSDYVVETPRTSLRLVSWCGGEGMISRSGLVIPLGRSCPEVYTHMSDVDATGEFAYDTLAMRKNHCVVSLAFRYETDADVKLTMRGSVCGYDRVGLPLEGDFRATAVKTSESGLPQVILPRQCGGELFLDVEGMSGNVRTFPLSGYIEAIGYDWTAPDLDDMRITIDIVRTTITLNVLGWDEEFFFDIVI